MKLSFRGKTYVFFLGATLVCFAILGIFFWRLFDAELRSQEHAHAMRQLALTERIFDNELENLAIKQADWARWDDVYEFVTDRNEEFILSNLNDESFRTINVHIMAFVNNSGELVYGKQIYGRTPEARAIPEALLNVFTGKSTLLNFDGTDSLRKGVLVIPEALLLVTAQPITTSDGRGGHRGTLIFARYIDDDSIATLSEFGGVQVRIAPFGLATASESEAYRTLSYDRPVSVTFPDGQVVAASLKGNIFGNPSWVLSVQYPADIFSSGQAFFWKTLGYALSGFTTYIALLIVGIEFFLLRHIESMRRVVRQVNALRAGKLPDKGVDDFSYLATVMAEALEKIAQSEYLTDASWNEITKFRMAIDESFDHIVIADVDGKILYANKAAEKLTGFSRFEMQGQTSDLWHRSTGHQFYDELWDTVRRRKQVFEGDATNKRKDGTLYHVHIRVAPVLDNKKRVMCFVNVEHPTEKA